MKANYKNWMPKHMIWTALIGFAVMLAVLLSVIYTSVFPDGPLKTTVIWVVFGLTSASAVASLWFIVMYRAFSYSGKRQLSRQIVEGLAAYVDLPEEGLGLDVGCGSGALTIACAKRNPQGHMVGIDPWDGEYKSYSKNLCDNNAQAEGAVNVSFAKGSATKLNFADETFDAVTSNYVYHNIFSKDRQAILLETLRTLKKGGVFAIHDLITKKRYGDMQAFMTKLKTMGYEDVQLIDTTDLLMSSKEAFWMGLSGSALLLGRK
ncbi:class I SAM-dependent methyltransferase [Streptococcus sp. H31]|uniref:class I SAM-dependent methyltransferase n=1 Tax=Streptococcus huangxiaojuni TaxID=3237239 RepID=UPI0034A21229